MTDTIVTGDIVTRYVGTGKVVERYVSDWRRRKLNFFIKSIHFLAHFAGPWNLPPRAAVARTIPPGPSYALVCGYCFCHFPFPSGHYIVQNITNTLYGNSLTLSSLFTLTYSYDTRA